MRYSSSAPNRCTTCAAASTLLGSTGPSDSGSDAAGLAGAGVGGSGSGEDVGEAGLALGVSGGPASSGSGDVVSLGAMWLAG